MINFYNDLETKMGKIESAWQKAQYSADFFPEIVWEQTERLDLSPLGEVSNQMKLMEIPSVRCLQKQSTFSDLYFRVFDNGRFMIEILNWWGGHVNVHDHDFSAVQFQLKGDALNVVYDFEEESAHGALRFGDLKVRQSEIWKEGSRSLVAPGDIDPHSVFHIGSPTTSLLIRTAATPRYGSQSNYFPTLAAHYYVSNDIQRKKLTALGLLARKNPNEFRALLNNCIATQSYSENFFMLLKLGSIVFGDSYVDIVSDYAAMGLEESKIVESVAINNGIDGLKTMANETEGLSYDEKLAAFIAAGSHNMSNRIRLVEQLSTHGTVVDFNKEISGFLNKLASDERIRAEQYIDLLGYGGPHASV